MPHYQQTPHRSSKVHLWAKRSVHLKTHLQNLPRRLRLDVEALVKIFLTRRSLLLKLADNYLVKLWECSRATAQVGKTGGVGTTEEANSATTATGEWDLETGKKIGFDPTQKA